MPEGQGRQQLRPPVNQVQRAPRTSDWAVLGLKRKLRKFPTIFVKSDFYLKSYSVVKLTISEILRRDRFHESQSPIPTRLLLRFYQFPSDSYTSKCKTRTLCTFATINRLAQINHKIDIKTSGNDVKHAWNNKKLSIRLTRIRRLQTDCRGSPPFRTEPARPCLHGRINRQQRCRLTLPPLRQGSRS